MHVAALLSVGNRECKQIPRKYVLLSCIIQFTVYVHLQDTFFLLRSYFFVEMLLDRFNKFITVCNANMVHS